ncbi:5-amino-6-(D-ribitylamino)uracil--L-tyrosine 4-hydroxyphenyl transferase CofH [Bosea sp. BK604]|uniref:5-amino-6-(D-ribitylamino)uracil--L-tyrosine 4-hydroxyphenyl transferase CofH n=1 Tax=Bosea sp. BK604 TaxID=2512180 RepID=UPI00104B9767|nr:5-amino-6-(D-ribitylamino)uracil--L-tyrosine 4-hydroxyphenyl transferase CofH [Bosea sp. BK604]TCR65644.1 FO synthase subunit 1 /FO synthase subunit 2 [Bosea sp. BK604]
MQRQGQARAAEVGQDTLIGPVDDAAALRLETMPLSALIAAAARLRDHGHGDLVSYSRKVFIPLTQLCRDVCHYCTFAHPPRRGQRSFMTPEEVLAVARDGARFGCKEALFTLGDKPELRYRAAREELAALGHETTLSYLLAMARLVREATGLLPHINAGLMSRAEIEQFKTVSVSQGIMLETISDRLSQRGGPHFGSPDKIPARRLAMIEAAGQAQVPFTTGLLIGIGETRAERIEALLAIRALHERYGHIQEIIIQNFRAKPGTRMAQAPEPSLDEQLWTVAVARLIFGATMNIQSPPNLRPEALAAIIGAGANDWGGVSPVTPDHVNPEAPWPEIERLAAQTEAAGKLLVERLAIYPSHLLDGSRWLAQPMLKAALVHADAEGFARADAWVAGAGIDPPRLAAPAVQRPASRELAAILRKGARGEELAEAEIVSLFAARGPAFDAVCRAADEIRVEACGDAVSYVVTRNINYTNICYFKCKFCAFSKGKLSENLRGRPYDLELSEIGRRAAEAWERGGTEVCLQGGIHPDYTGRTYLEICRTIRAVAPDIHIHAFSPLEIWQGAATLKLSVREFLLALKEAGLSSLPGTAAEILDDEVRAVICPDKIRTEQWLSVVETAHEVGLRSTATIMFGHVDRYEHWARHLLRIRRLQARTGGFTEFVPLPFVPMETPIFLRAASRKGPTYREAVLMHAVSRITLNPLIDNIQVSWVKMGADGMRDCLRAGVNDLGGTLMEETITRSAGALHGQEMAPSRFLALIAESGRQPRPRTTLYGDAAPTRVAAALAARPLLPSHSAAPRKRELSATA